MEESEDGDAEQKVLSRLGNEGQVQVSPPRQVLSLASREKPQEREVHPLQVKAGGIVHKIP